MMEFVRKNFNKWLTGAIVLVVGILCIVAGAQMQGANGGVGDTIDAISMVLGITLIIVASLGLILALVGAILSKSGEFAGTALAVASTLALGIWFVVEKTAYEILSLIIGFVPYILLIAGAILAVDAIFGVVFGLVNKNIKEKLVDIIVYAVLAVVAIVLGALCIGNDPVIEGSVQLIVVGVLIVLAGAGMIVQTFFHRTVAVAAAAVVADAIDSAKESEEKTESTEESEAAE